MFQILYLSESFNLQVLKKLYQYMHCSSGEIGILSRSNVSIESFDFEPVMSSKSDTISISPIAGN